MTKTTLNYDMKTCGRCGGSGRYSYNMMHGSVCYGCSGNKKVLTKDGAKAVAAIKAFKAAHFSVMVKDLKPGDRVTVPGNSKPWTVGDVTTSDAMWTSGGKSGHYTYVNFPKVKDSFFGGTGLTHGFCYPTDTVVKAVGGADWDTVVAFARTLKKGVTVTDTEVAAVAA